MKENKFCQSCGFPLKQDKNGGGSEKNGTINKEYCSMCYQDGEFLNPEINTAKKMQDFCVIEMKKSGMNGLLAYILTRQIPKLRRWK